MVDAVEMSARKSGEVVFRKSGEQFKFWMASKSSDRRLAGGPRAARFLHGAQKSSGNEGGKSQSHTRPEPAQNHLGGGDQYHVSGTKEGTTAANGTSSGAYSTGNPTKNSRDNFFVKKTQNFNHNQTSSVTKTLQFGHKNSPNFHNSKVSKPSTKTVRRSANGKSWEDDTLVEWDPNHFRLFVGNLGPDANDQLLVDAFGKYPSFVKARVPRDKRADKNKGYGFVAFASADDYLRAFKEMNGKYVGLHPVQLKRAETQVKARKR